MYIYTYIYVYIYVYIYLYINFLCLDIKMSMNNFFKKTFFKISYISVYSKTFLNLLKTVYNVNNSKIPKEQI